MKWEMRDFRDMNEFSSHPSAILSDGFYSIFAKLSTASNGQEQFECELAGLRLLSELAGVLIPTPIGTIPLEGSIVMLLEGIQEIDRTPKEWRQIGQTLAHIHQTKGQQFGLDTHNYFGPLYQDNRPLSDWAAFYAERRLWPRFMGAVNAGHMPTEVIRQVEKLILRIPTLCDSSVIPTLLHGDAQQHNFISTEKGAVVIDPAIYYGHPEMDLAYVDYFHPVPDDLFIGYQEILPIDPGFSERRELWRIYGYLAIAEVEGAPFLPQLTKAVSKYL
jgi:fructosamine-3-kinase